MANRRTDHWGGDLTNRARLLLDIVRDVRAGVSPGFAVAVKLYSADFQCGGFDAEDAQAVIEMLAPLGVDIVELSGGSYEAPAMTGQAKDERTQAREAYFLTLAEDLARTSPLPLMPAGGVDLAPVRIEDKAVASAASMARVRQQLRRLGAGRRTRPGMDPNSPSPRRPSSNAATARGSRPTLPDPSSSVIQRRIESVWMR